MLRWRRRRRRSFCQTMANNTLYRRRDDAFYVAVHLRERREGEKDTLTRSVKESSCVISLRFRVNSFVTNTLSLFVTAQIEGRQGGRVQTGGHLKFNMELTVAQQPPQKSKLLAREQKSTLTWQQWLSCDYRLAYTKLYLLGKVARSTYRSYRRTDTERSEAICNA